MDGLARRATFGVGSSVLPTATVSPAQLGGVERLDLLLILGAVVTADAHPARVAGFALRLVTVEVFTLF